MRLTMGEGQVDVKPQFLTRRRRIRLRLREMTHVCAKHCSGLDSISLNSCSPRTSECDYVWE